MYKIDIFDRISMKLDWYMVYYGISNNMLDIDVAQEFACRKLMNTEEVKEELELSWGESNRLDVLELIAKMLKTQHEDDKNMEEAKEKLRTAIIIFLRDSEKDVVKMLDKIDITYAEFGYPEDMEKFISYMPVPMDDKDILEQCTVEDSRKYLLNNLDKFIERQKRKYALK